MTGMGVRTNGLCVRFNLPIPTELLTSAVRGSTWQEKEHVPEESL